MLKIITLAALVAIVSSNTPLYDSHPSFTLRTLKTVRESTLEKNVFMSPHSTFHALLVAFFGAEGQTKVSLRKGLFTGNENNVNEQIIRPWYAEEMRILAEMIYAETVRFISFDRVYITRTANIKWVKPLTQKQKLFLIINYAA